MNFNFNFNFNLALTVLCSGAIALGLGVTLDSRKSVHELHSSQGQSESVNESQPVIQSPKLPRAVDKIAITRSPQMKDIRSEDSIFGVLNHSFAIAKDATPHTLRELSVEALNDPDPLYSYNVATIFIEKMVADDPYKALAFVEALTTDVQRVSMVSHVLTSWVRYNEDAALTYFQGISDLQLKTDLGTRFLMDTSLSSSFISAVTLELGPLAERVQERVRIRSTPAEDLFAQALAKKGNGRRRELRTAAWRWFSRDQETALKAISNLPTANERNELMQSLLSGFVTRDPQQALELLGSFAAENNKVQRAVLATYASNDPAQAIVEVERYISSTPDSKLLTDLLASWVEKDPDAAIQYAQGLSSEDQRRAYKRMARKYIASEPIAGLRWAASLGDENGIADSLFFGSVNSQNLAEAESLILQIGPSRTRKALITAVSRQKADINPASTLEWLEQFEGDDGYEQAYNSTLLTWSSADPESVAYYIEQQDSPLGYEALVDVVGTWYTRDKNAAHDWVTNLPDSTGKQAAVAGLVKSTVRTDSKLAIELFEALAPGDLRDQAALELVATLALTDKVAAKAAVDKLGLSYLMSEALLDAIANSR